MAQKPRGFSRDLCEIPAMPRVKKKTALRANPRPRPRLALHPLAASASRLEMEIADAHRSAAGDLPHFREEKESRKDDTG